MIFCERRNMETRGSTSEVIPQISAELAQKGNSTGAQRQRDELSREQLSYLRLLYVLIGSIFIAELLAMGLISVLPALPYYIVSIIDAGIMVVLIFPVLYFLSFQ